MEHSATLLACINLHYVFKTFVLSLCEWPLKTGITVDCLDKNAVYIYKSVPKT